MDQKLLEGGDEGRFRWFWRGNGGGREGVEDGEYREGGDYERED